MPENGARISIFASLRLGELQRRPPRPCRLFSASSFAWPEMKLLFARSTARSYLVLASVRLARACCDLGLVDGGIEPHQHRALGDALAFLERDRADAPGDFGPQRDRFVGAQAADRGDRLRHRRRRHLDRLDGHRAAPRGAPAGAVAARLRPAPRCRDAACRSSAALARANSRPQRPGDADGDQRQTALFIGCSNCLGYGQRSCGRAKWLRTSSTVDGGSPLARDRPSAKRHYAPSRQSGARLAPTCGEDCAGCARCYTSAPRRLTT